jgi:hypothetical protein
MKHLEDTRTLELPGIEPAPAKVGRKPIFGRAMTDAERKRRQREKDASAVKIDPSGLPDGRS